LRTRRPTIFVSAKQTGTGSAQNIAHGLGVIPRLVFIALCDGPGTWAAPTFTEGSHTATNCVITIATGFMYKVVAIA